MRHAPLLIALAVATTAHADGERTLHLAVHGSIDSAVVAAALAKELAVEVAVVDGTCDVPCLDVAIDGKHIATVMFAPRSGSPRARSVALGNNTAQWPLVITLLAGNVVRDEAQDVLAGLPRDLPKPPEAGSVPGDVPPAPEDAAPEVAESPQPTPTPTPTADDEPEPQPEAAPPGSVAVISARPAAPPPVEPPREHRMFGLGFVPVLSTDLTHVGSVRHFLSLNVLVGVSGGSSGLSLSGIADIQRGLVAGLQLAGIVAVGQSLAAGFQIGGVAAVAQQVAGTQIAGIAAVAGEVDGVQIGGNAAVAARVDGVQVAGIAAVSRSSADTQVGGVAAFAPGSAGTQVGGIAVRAGGDAGFQVGGVAASAQGNAGVQLAGIAAVAGGNANFQSSGLASVTRGTANIQIAGLVNYAQRVRGIQLAPINVAHEVDGIQIGVINVGGSTDGFSFGLINIVPGGRHDLETAIDSNKTGTLLFRHGGRRWHNVYGIGGHAVKETGPSDDVWMYGLGFGPSLEFDNTVIDLEAIGWQVNHGPRHESDVSVLGQLRLSVAHKWGPFAIVAGGILNAYVTSDQQSPLILERRATGAPMATGVTVTTWPSAFVGLRI